MATVSVHSTPVKENWPSVELGQVYEGYRKRKRTRSPSPRPQRAFEAPLPSQLLFESDDEDLSCFEELANQLDELERSENSLRTEPKDLYFYDTGRQNRPAQPELTPQYISAPNQPQSTATSPPPAAAATAAAAPPTNDEEPALCPEQQELVDLVTGETHPNVFYTGSAGCGKSTVLKALVSKIKASGRTVHVVAPTGISALQIDGMTTWTYMGWEPDCFRQKLRDLESRVFNKRTLKRIRSTDVLILDEISMVENKHLERMNHCMKAARNWGRRPLEEVRPFGGVQMIVTGDFCQLPPVRPFQICMQCGGENVKSHNQEQLTHSCTECNTMFVDDDKWAFRSDAWAEARFIHLHLQNIHRQSDKDFIRMLQKCRLGVPFDPPESHLLLNHPANVLHATRLFCTRIRTDEENNKRFAELNATKVTYNARQGYFLNPRARDFMTKEKVLKNLKHNRMQVELELKSGMLVILQVNLDLRNGLCNGSMGRIIRFVPVDVTRLPKAKTDQSSHDEGQVIYGDHAQIKEREIREFARNQKYQPEVYLPCVEFHNGQVRVIRPECMVNTVGAGPEFHLVYRTQIPLVAGWAMTIHKSQGMSLDRVIVNLRDVFEEKQVYVALSRARNLAGLKVEGNHDDLAAARGGSQAVMEFFQQRFPSVIQEILEPQRTG